ncbi:P-loop containing nucleoside triphosphate hydrolases superfamily protein [Rhynchospora pubera]|uniref:P-loop containing nucleoside triphosphate hydrolases superfamily protein n=1 Tax=Rhynchospora pubera TaxID=906938 RepID=A0AAV8GEK8_9POAL|nr:P-loop containing nucleoside triphosphate hydrolases superfamily protein [Rhynchospora pubera]
MNLLSFLGYLGFFLLLLRVVLSYKSLLHLSSWCWRKVGEWAQVYQYFDVPRYDANSQENPLYRKALAYMAWLPSLEGSDSASLFSSASRSNVFSVHLGPGQTARDSFLGAHLTWTRPSTGPDRLVLRVRRQDRVRVLRPYLLHLESEADKLMLNRRELHLFTNTGTDKDGTRWLSLPFTHPATLDTLAMDSNLKTRVHADLEAFLEGRAYYHRMGRVWRRSYLLYGPPGTGKSSFVAAMARFLGFDIYAIDLSNCKPEELRNLLVHTSPRSIILMEDLDRYLEENGNSGTASILSIMDGIFSCCSEERVMVFTMSREKEGVDPAILRPGRLDVHIHFSMCDFNGFKALASNYLGVNEHKLFQHVEEGFQTGAQISHAEVSEIMIANRRSPTRAIKTVLNALQYAAGEVKSSSAMRRISQSFGASRLSNAVKDEESEVPHGDRGDSHVKDNAPVREIKKLYGLIKLKSRREGTVVPVDVETPTVRNEGSKAVEFER